MIYFVGDKPSKLMKPGAEPFQGAKCEARLNEWIKAVSYDQAVIIINQVDYLYMWFWAGDIYIALGNNASKKLGNLPHFKLPHPSGLNRQINDEAFIATKLAECKAYIDQRLSI